MRLSSLTVAAVLTLLFQLSQSPSIYAKNADLTDQSSLEADRNSHLVDAAIFANPGHFGNPKLSPSGERVLFRQQIKGKTYLTTSVIYKNDTHRIAIPEDVNLGWYRWAGNDRILFSVSKVAATKFGNRRHTGLLVSNIHTNETITLGRKVQGFDGDNVLFVDPEGRYLLLSMQRSVYDYPDVYRVRLDNNEMTRVISKQSRIWTWIADNQGKIRMGLSYTGGTLRIYYRSNEDEKFKQIGKIKKNDDLEEALVDITHVVSGADEGFVLSNKETGRFALYKFNYLTRETGEMIFGHDENDVTGFDLNSDGTKLEAVYFTDSRDRKKWFNEYFTDHQAKLDKALPGQEAWIQSKSRDGKRMIVFSTSPTDPGSYYLYEPEQKKLSWFASVNKKLGYRKAVEY